MKNCRRIQEISRPTGPRTFYLASPRALRNNFCVKNKILLSLVAIGLMLTSGCISIGN